MDYEIKRQRPIKGGRKRLSPLVEAAIDSAVRADAKRFHCSLNYVVKTALADAMGIVIEERYDSELNLTTTRAQRIKNRRPNLLRRVV